MESLFKLKISYLLSSAEGSIIKELSINPSAFINSLKETIREALGIPENDQNLVIHRDKTQLPLENVKTIEEYNLKNGDTIYLATSSGLQASDIDVNATYYEEVKTYIEAHPSKAQEYVKAKGGDSSDSSGGEEDEETRSKNKSLILDVIPKDAEVLIKELKESKPTSVKNLIDDLLRKEQDAPELRVKIMIDENADGGWNSLHYAVYLGLNGVVKELLERNADVNKLTEDGWSPLQLAIDQNHELICKMLLETQELNINVLTPKSTALHIAAKAGNKKLAQILLFHDVSLAVKDHEGKLPMEVAADKQIAEMLQVSERELKEHKKPQNLKEEAMPPKPFGVKGWLWKLGPFFNHKKRYFVLDPNIFTFSHYMNEAECPKKPRKIVSLLEIKDVKKINSGWLMKKEYCYFELHYEGKSRIFASKTEQTQTQWVEYLKQAIAYAGYVDQKIKQHLYFINDFDENATSPKKLHSTYFMKVDTNVELLDQTETEKKISEAKKEEQKVLMQPCDKTSTFYIKEFDHPEGTDMCLENFDAISKIGNGAFGTVYKVKRRSDGKLFAIKTLKKRSLLSRNQMGSAISEKNIMQKALNPYVLKIEYAFQTRDYLYLCLEFCPGGDLSFILEEKEKLTEDETRTAAAELIVIIDYLHSINVLYRDMKPDNILIDEDGHLKIIDFGLSKLGIKNDMVCKTFCGSPAYLAPEMLKRQGATWATDIYGIGTILYELLSGEPPFYSHDISTIYDNMKKGKLVMPKHLSANAKDLLTRLLDQNPASRIGVNDKKEIMKHPFFTGVDWEKVAKKQGPAPFPPKK